MLIYRLYSSLYIERRKKSIFLRCLFILYYSLCIISFHSIVDLILKKIILISLFSYIIDIPLLYFKTGDDNNERKHSTTSSSSSFVSFPSMPKNCFLSSLFAMPRVCVFFLHSSFSCYCCCCHNIMYTNI